MASWSVAGSFILKILRQTHMCVKLFIAVRMAGFGLRGSWCACFIVVAMLLPSLCLGQTEGFGGAQFATVVIPTGGDPDAIAVADLNHDGAPDIAVANPESGTVTVLLGDGKGHFQKASGSPFAAGHLPSDIGIGDFNGDGHPDLLIANHQSSYLTLLLGEGHGSFRPAPHSPFVTTARPHPHGVVVGRACRTDSTQPVVSPAHSLLRNPRSARSRVPRSTWSQPS